MPNAGVAVSIDLEAIASLLRRLGERLMTVPMTVFAGLVVVIALLKATFVWDPHIFRIAEAFPEPISEKSNQLTGIALTTIVQGSPWVYLVVVGATLILSVAYVWRSNDSSPITSSRSRTRLILAASWPLPLTSLAWFGFGNELMVLFVALAVLANKKVMWIIGVLGAPLSHPELSLMSFGGLWLLGFADEFRRFRIRGLIGMLWSLTLVAATSWWMHTSGAPSRLEILPDFVAGTIRAQLRHGLMGLYSAWSVWWIVILIGVVIVGRRARRLILFTAVIGPSIVVLVTADATRDFAGAAAAVGLAIYWRVVQDPHEGDVTPIGESSSSRGAGMLGLMFLAFILMPNIQFKTTNNPVPQPGDVWIGLLEVYVLPWLSNVSATLI